MKTPVFLIILLTFIILTFFITKNFYTDKLKQYQIKINACQQAFSDKKNQVDNLNDLFFLSQKVRAQASIKKNDLYFRYHLEKLETGLFKISVYLEGDEKAAADAADLKINFDNLQVRDLTTGKAFPSYPRKLTKDNYLLVTGVAIADENSFVYGQPDVFAEFTVRKIDPAKKSEATLDLEGTKIYLDGESVFNTEKAFKEILTE